MSASLLPVGWSGTSCFALFLSGETEVAGTLIAAGLSPKAISGFMWDNWVLIEIAKDINLSPHKFRVYSKKRRKDVTDEV